MSREKPLENVEEDTRPKTTLRIKEVNKLPKVPKDKISWKVKKAFRENDLSSVSVLAS
jgi:hypothetical protein